MQEDKGTREVPGPGSEPGLENSVRACSAGNAECFRGGANHQPWKVREADC